MNNKKKMMELFIYITIVIIGIILLIASNVKGSGNNAKSVRTGGSAYGIVSDK